MKIYVKYVKYCSQCPNCWYDNNITRWECRKRDNEFIAWMSDNDDKIEIPKWCPLQDAETLNSEDFEI
jgi:hypothetical protein